MRRNHAEKISLYTHSHRFPLQPPKTSKNPERMPPFPGFFYLGPLNPYNRALRASRRRATDTIVISTVLNRAGLRWMVRDVRKLGRGRIGAGAICFHDVVSYRVFGLFDRPRQLSRRA